MQNNLLYLLILFVLIINYISSSSASLRPYQTRPIMIEIISVYEQNPKVWGTYKLDTEQIYQIIGKQKNLLQIISNRFSQETLLFEKNRLFFIHNQSNFNSKGQLLIKSFPYQNGRSMLTIELYKNKNDYFDLNYSKLNMILSGLSKDEQNSLNGPEYLYVGNMNCNKKYKKFTCKTNLTLSVI